jgi:hypothetical protein
MKLADIYQAAQALANISARVLPFKVSYALAKLKRRADADLKFIEDERIKLVKKHGESDGADAFVVRDPAKFALFQKDLEELLALESEREYRPVTLALADAETISLAPADWAALEPFVTVEEAPADGQ